MTDTPDLTPRCPHCDARIDRLPATGWYPLSCPSCGAALPPFRYPLRQPDPRQAFRPQEDERQKEPQ